MRYLALALLAAGCLDQPAAPPPVPPPTPTPEPPPSPPPSPPPPSPSPYCSADTDCPADQVCARDDTCTPASEVRWVHVRWTVDGAPADATTCASRPDLVVEIGDSVGAAWGVAPVPCDEGVYSVDKIPLSWTTATVATYLGEGVWQNAIDTQIDPATGDATLDLTF